MWKTHISKNLLWNPNGFKLYTSFYMLTSITCILSGLSGILNYSASFSEDLCFKSFTQSVRRCSAEFSSSFIFACKISAHIWGSFGGNILSHGQDINVSLWTVSRSRRMGIWLMPSYFFMLESTFWVQLAEGRLPETTVMELCWGSSLINKKEKLPSPSCLFEIMKHNGAFTVFDLLEFKYLWLIQTKVNQISILMVFHFNGFPFQLVKTHLLVSSLANNPNWYQDYRQHTFNLVPPLAEMSSNEWPN